MARLEVLQRERAGYVVRGLTDRVAQVDAAIRSLGGKPPVDEPTVEAPAPALVETAVKPAVKRGRK